MKFTKNYNLKQPGYNDPVDIKVLNENAEILDEIIEDKAGKNELADLERRIKEEIANVYEVSPTPPKDTRVLWIDTSKREERFDVKIF